jgi:hypothetical protein
VLGNSWHALHTKFLVSFDMTELTPNHKGHNFKDLVPEKYYSLILILCIGVLVALVSARYMSLDADPHPGYIPIDSGYHIDEGYKTFAPKNLLAFGTTIWHENDDYYGWMETSPLTQWPYYLAYENFGLELANARAVTVIYFCLFIIAVFSFLKKRYGLLLTLVATLLLTADVALFHFSRSALFEIALVFFVYFGILMISRLPNDRPALALVVSAVPVLIAMYVVKLSAILYFAPTVLALSAVFANDSVRPGRRKLLYFLAFVSAVVILAFLTRDTWMHRIPLDAILYLPKKLILNPMPDLSIFALLLGYGCIIHLLLVKPEALYKDLYRLSLAATVIFTPMILALFSYNPPRYYVVIIPACLLLIVEWVHLQPWTSQKNISLTIQQKILAAILFVPFTMLLMRAFNILVLENIPFNIGGDPGISIPGLYKIFPFALLGLAALVYITRTRFVAALGTLIPLFVVLHFVTGVMVQTNVLTEPSYDSQKIRSALAEIMQDNESVAGDWAAFFTAEAPIRSFYMTKDINVPTAEHLDEIRPDYFLHSDSPFDPMSLELLQSNDRIALSDPVLLGNYVGNEIQLYKISYQ